MRTRGLPRPTIFFHIILQTARFLKKKKIITKHKMFCFDFLYKFCLKKFLVLSRNERDVIKEYLLGIM